MRVREAIAILSKLDPDLRVLVDGYEYGLCDLFEKNVRQVRFESNRNSEDYAGPHEERSEGDQIGVVLGRGWEIET